MTGRGGGQAKAGLVPAGGREPPLGVQRRDSWVSAVPEGAGRGQRVRGGAWGLHRSTPDFRQNPLPSHSTGGTKPSG